MPVSLLFAAIIMVVFDPSLPIFNLSFELSFLASLGILFLAKPIERSFYVVWKNIIRNSFRKSSAQSAVTPLIIGYFWTIFFYVVASKCFVAPLVPYAMLATFISGLVGLLSSWIGMLFWACLYFTLDYYSSRSILATSHFQRGLDTLRF